MTSFLRAGRRAGQATPVTEQRFKRGPPTSIVRRRDPAPRNRRIAARAATRLYNPARHLRDPPMRLLYLDIDSLRPDHLGCYGYPRATSPHIDRLAEQAIRFDNVYASDVPCLPSRAAMFTGRFGIHTGVINHGGAQAELWHEGRERGFGSVLGRTSFVRGLRDLGLYTATVSSFAERHAAFFFYAGFNEVLNPGRRGLETADEVGRPGPRLARAQRRPRQLVPARAALGPPHALPHAGRRRRSLRPGARCRPGSPRRCAPPTCRAAGPTPRARRWATTTSRRPTCPGAIPRQPLSMDSAGGRAPHVRRLRHGGLVRRPLRGRAARRPGGRGRAGRHRHRRHRRPRREPGRAQRVRRSPDRRPGHRPGAACCCAGPSPCPPPGPASTGPSTIKWTWPPPCWSCWVAGCRPAGTARASPPPCGSAGKRGARPSSSPRAPGPASARSASSATARSTCASAPTTTATTATPTRCCSTWRRTPTSRTTSPPARPAVVHEALARLERWVADMMIRATHPADPMWVVLHEGGPKHTRGQLPRYLERLRATGRARWAELLVSRHPREAT